MTVGLALFAIYTASKSTGFGLRDAEEVGLWFDFVYDIERQLVSLLQEQLGEER